MNKLTSLKINKDFEIGYLRLKGGVVLGKASEPGKSRKFKKPKKYYKNNG
jgi:hypothetical protein